MFALLSEGLKAVDWGVETDFMKPIFQRLTSAPDEGFAFKVIRAAGFDCPWHFHDEYELILVQKSSGYRMVGDNLKPLMPGDLVLIGPNLPHIWQNDERGLGGGTRVHAVLIQFEEKLLADWLRLPALTPLRQLLQRAALGVEVTGHTRQRVAELMVEMSKLRGLSRIAQFLLVLDALARSHECRQISSPGFINLNNPFNQARMNVVFRFINEHLDHPVSLPQVAELVHLSAGAFSRFFHVHTGKTFPVFVNELRIGRACRLLVESELGVAEIAEACGFANLSNFNRQFMRLKRLTPRAFRHRVAGTN
jgi:AraC-like DNA-binding protein/quercetin dioxygenase-like cupin family protein